MSGKTLGLPPDNATSATGIGDGSRWPRAVLEPLLVLAFKKAKSVLSDEHEARDVAQTVVAALVARPDPPSNPGAWVTQRASWLALNELRRRRREAEKFERLAQQPSAPSEDFTDRVAARLLLDDILAPLSPQQRKALEQAVAQQAIALVGQHWEDIQRLAIQRLGRAYQEDDGRVLEVATMMIARYRNGFGGTVRYLLDASEVDPDQARRVLMRDVWYFCREVVGGAVAERERAHQRTELDDEFTDVTAAEPGFDPPADVDLITGLLAAGEEAWESLCEEGVLARDDWTEDQKWTAIGMMWGFSAKAIADIRRLRAGNGSANPESTYQMVSQVRKKGRTLAERAPSVRKLGSPGRANGGGAVAAVEHAVRVVQAGSAGVRAPS